MSNKIEIGKKIKQLRKEKKWSQAILGEYLRREGATISRIESGEIELTPLMAALISATFGVREEWLLTGKEPKYTIEIRADERMGKVLNRGEINVVQTLELVKHIVVIDATRNFNPKFIRFVNQLSRIYMEGNKTKIDMLTGMLKILDPGEKNEAIKKDEDEPS